MGDQRLATLSFSADRKTGVLFHMMGALSEHGKVGVTAVGDSADEAESLFRSVVEMLDRETGADGSPAQAIRPKALHLSME